MVIRNNIEYQLIDKSLLPPGLTEHAFGKRGDKVLVGEEGREVYLQPLLLKGRNQFLQITQGKNTLLEHLKYIQ
ncbi:MAG: hypothetical protein V1788_01685 [Nanoarchaeota archaeon]|nr:hypothetical protein [Nanoarchaeota archaeon]